MDNDGDLDMITARVINDGPITPLDQDLLWFENDGTPESREQWKMHRIAGESILLILNLYLVDQPVKSFWKNESMWYENDERRLKRYWWSKPMSITTKPTTLSEKDEFQPWLTTVDHVTSRFKRNNVTLPSGHSRCNLRLKSRGCSGKSTVLWTGRLYLLGLDHSSLTRIGLPMWPQA